MKRIKCWRCGGYNLAPGIKFEQSVMTDLKLKSIDKATLPFPICKRCIKSWLNWLKRRCD